MVPDYRNSIVNLMGSIMKYQGLKSKYASLKNLKPNELSGSKNVVLMIIDGLGYDYVSKYGKGTILQEGLRSGITSVFPSTTAACITTFYTGKAPQEHAITGWFMYSKEADKIIMPLPFEERGGKKLRIDPSAIFTEKPILEKIKNPYLVMYQPLIKSKYNSRNAKGAKALGYTTLNSFFRQTKKAVFSDNKKKFVHAYWPGFDSVCHEYGKSSLIAKVHFKALVKGIAWLKEQIKGTDTIIIITADHGHLDIDKSKRILLSKHKKLKQCLSRPLSGELRAAYCYLKKGKEKQFEEYIKTIMKGICKAYKSKDLVKKNYFGLGRPSEKLLERIGDYVLVMENGYIIKDFLPGEIRKFNIGNHGGVSKEEMLVPLIVINV